MTKRPENFRVVRFLNYEANETKKSKIGQLWYDSWLEKDIKFWQKTVFYSFFCHKLLQSEPEAMKISEN